MNTALNHFDSIFPIQMDRADFLEHSKECDGICRYCGNISLAVADPKSDSVFCYQCENKSVVGMMTALALRLVVVRAD